MQFGLGDVMEGREECGTGPESMYAIRKGWYGWYLFSVACGNRRSSGVILGLDFRSVTFNLFFSNLLASHCCVVV